MSSTKRQGRAEVVLECHDECKESEYGKPEVITMKHSYPLKVLVPSHTGNKYCKWIFPIVFGGGLVGGDQVDIVIETKANTCGLLTSQESTKVYKCEDGSLTTQTLTYKVGDNSLLCIIPDYCVCYKDANFSQTQTVEMSDTGNLVLLDWLTCGRVARGEKWAFSSFKNCLQINVKGETLFKDTAHLQDVPGLTVQQSMREYQVTGTFIILGKKMKELSNNLYKLYSKPKKFGESATKDVICTVSVIQKGGMSGVYLRFLATDTAKAYTVLKEIINPLIPTLGSDPFHNKYG